MKHALLLAASILLACSAAAHAGVERSRLATLSRGVNLIDVFTHTPMFRIKAGLNQIQAAGLRHVRIFVDPDWVIQHAGAQPDRLEDVVKAAVADRLGVILCMSSDKHPMDGSATHDVVRLWTRAWSALARRYAQDFPAGSVFFELANEPTMNPERWNRVQDELLRAVRAVAPNNTILLAGTPFSTSWALADLAPSNAPDVVYAVHLYQPMVFTHQGAEWDPRFRPIRGLEYPPRPANVASAVRGVPASVAEELRDYARSGAGQPEKDLAFARKMAKEHHLHIVVTEFGVYRAAPPASRARWFARARRMMQADGFGWTVWEFDGGFGIKPDLNQCTPVAHALALRCVP